MPETLSTAAEKAFAGADLDSFEASLRGELVRRSGLRQGVLGTSAGLTALGYALNAGEAQERPGGYGRARGRRGRGGRSNPRSASLR